MYDHIIPGSPHNLAACLLLDHRFCCSLVAVENTSGIYIKHSRPVFLRGLKHGLDLSYAGICYHEIQWTKSIDTCFDHLFNFLDLGDIGSHTDCFAASRLNLLDSLVDPFFVGFNIVNAYRVSIFCKSERYGEASIVKVRDFRIVLAAGLTFRDYSL